MIRTVINDAIGQIILDRPEAMNAFTESMYDDLASAVIELDSASSVHVVLITGEGKDFCSGNDISTFVVGEKIDPQKLSDPNQSAPAKAVKALADARKPLIAAVQGRAIGFGATLLLHCDHVTMAENASLLFPFTQIGLVPEAGSSLLMQRTAGSLRAREIFFDPRPIRADEAVRLGLASCVEPENQAAQKAYDTALRWTGRPVGSTTRTKALLKQAEQGLSAQIEHEFHQLAHSINDPETQKLFKAMTGS